MTRLLAPIFCGIFYLKTCFEVRWAAVCAGKLVNGDLVVVLFSKLVKRTLASRLHDLLPPYSLNDF